MILDKSSYACLGVKLSDKEANNYVFYCHELKIIKVQYTRECEWQRSRVQILASTSNSNVPIVSIRQNDADIWRALFINSSTSCCYFNTSFMCSIFGRCHAHSIYYSIPCYYFNTSFMRSIYLVDATPTI